MKIFFLLILPYSFSFTNYHYSSLWFVFTDTTSIVHILDGNTAEWPKTKFDTDNETKAQYATDNNDKMLFLALKIYDKEVQKKILIKGMDLYIDTKGKKKETKGIEFPIKASTANDPDKSLSNLKLFGFPNISSDIQSTTIAGSVNIAAAWDSLNVLNIEYNIPIEILGGMEELKNKKISIGWKLNEEVVEEVKENKNSNQPATTTTIVGVPAGTRPTNTNINRNTGPNRGAINPMPQSAKALSFWTTYTVIF